MTNPKSVYNQLREKAKKILKNRDVLDKLKDVDIDKLLEELQIHQIELGNQNEELNNAKDDLFNSKNKYFELFDLAPVGYFSYNDENIIDDVNLLGTEMLGAPKNLLINQRFNSYIDPDFQDIFHFHTRNLLRTGEKQVCELKMINAAGQVFFVHMETTMRLVDGKRSIRSALIDITDRVNIESNLRDNEERFRLITENANSLICELDYNLRFKYINAAYNNLLGYSPHDLRGKKISEISHPDETPDLLSELEYIYKNESSSLKNWKFKQKKGEYRIFSCTSNVNTNYIGEKSIILISDDITDQLRSQERLKRSEHLYRTLVRNMPGLDLFLFDTNLTFLIAEGKEMHKQGQSKDYFEGKSFYDTVDKKLQPFIKPLYLNALTGIHSQKEFEYNDNFYYIETVPVYDDNGRVYAGLAIIMNITDDKKKEELLNKAKEEAEEASKAKSMFLANMSHEIRTPLTAIIGFTEQLAKTPLTETQEKYNKLVHSSSEQLLSIVNDVLTLTKLGVNKFIIEKEEFNLQELIGEVYNSINIKAREKNLEFILSIPDNIDITLISDKYRIKQVLLNLIGNAIKFTPGGYVKFGMSALPVNNRITEITFTIEDSGIGIQKNKIKNIFDEFSQGDTSITRQHGGSGLGLTISKKIIDLLNGELTVTSKPNKGSVFTVTLPLEQGSKKTLSRSNNISPVALNQLEGKKILLVDDDEVNRFLGETILLNWNVNVKTANDGEQALEILNKKIFDLVLMDIHMPKKSGTDVTLEIRQNKENPNNKTPVIAVTANILRKDLQEFLRAGMNDYVVKPYMEKDLAQVICKNLKIENELINVREQERVPNKGTIYDLQDLKKTSGINNNFFNKMLKMFIDNSRKAEKTILDSLNGGSYKKAGEAAHKILPSYKHLKVSRGIELLTLIENMRETVPDEDKAREIIIQFMEFNKLLINELEKEVKI
ncbi:MAG: PAS domain S-box protein [Bacteroidales bacterium]